MHRSVALSLGWEIQSWELASGSAASQDAKLVWPDPAGRCLRLAVLDGVTPSQGCRPVVGVDGAMYAAAIARLALQHAERPLEECVLAANRHVHDRALARSRDQAQTCVTAADVFPDGRVEVVRAGDCEAWARTADGWVSMGSGDALTPSTAAAWDEWQRRHATASRAVRHDAEERILGSPQAWTSTAVGRFPEPVLQRFALDGVSELVLASDGARLSEPVLRDLSSWLGGLRDWERERAHLGLAAGKVHDDVTVLRVVREERMSSAPRSVHDGRSHPRRVGHGHAADRGRRAA
jgi:serine/threonine protein phosphatase PrpC